VFTIAHLIGALPTSRVVQKQAKFMADETVTLEPLSRQQQRLLGEMQLLREDVRKLGQENSLIRDDISVLSAMAARQDHGTKALLDDMRTLYTQIARMNDRISKLEDA
jgi:hypothetical protein